MTLHLSAIRNADHRCSNVRVLSRIRQEKTEQLRDELDNVHPLLRWPIRPKPPPRTAA